MEKEEFCEQIRMYKLDLYRFAKSILIKEPDIEDAISEAIVQAYANRDQLRNKESFKVWLIKILANECYKILKKQSKVIYHEDLQIFNQKYEEKFESGEALAITTIVSRLNPRLRIVIALYYYEELSVQDISKTLNIAEGTVKSRLSRGRNKVKEALQAQDREEIAK